jgi:hypothetical protein
VDRAKVFAVALQLADSDFELDGDLDDDDDDDDDDDEAVVGDLVRVDDEALNAMMAAAADKAPACTLDPFL